jgi:integrase
MAASANEETANMSKSIDQVSDNSSPSSYQTSSAARAPATLSQAYSLFLASSTFSVRTRQSYAEDLHALLTTIRTQPVAALTHDQIRQFLGRQEHLAAATYNRRLAAVRSFCRWLGRQDWFDGDALLGLDGEDTFQRRAEKPHQPLVLDPSMVESILHRINDPRDRALFWLIYDAGLSSQEALSIDLGDINWSEREICIRTRWGKSREIFFSRHVATLLDRYWSLRDRPTSGPLFITHRKARASRASALTPDGYARLSYRQAEIRWKCYAPGWTLHQLRHTAISARAAKAYTDVDLKRFSGHRSARSLERYRAEIRATAKCRAN